MPQFVWSTLMTANQLGLNPLSGWQYEYLPWPAQVLLLIRSTTVGNRLTVYSGSETIQERTPVQGGGTIGVTPSELNTPAISFQAAAGDRLKLVIDEVLAGTPTVDGVAIVNPIFEAIEATTWPGTTRFSSAGTTATCKSCSRSKANLRHRKWPAIFSRRWR